MTEREAAADCVVGGGLGDCLHGEGRGRRFLVNYDDGWKIGRR